MRLKQIRLSGFKSFVDPTVMSFPSNRVGVLGPNGCGKSNVIDAVRWVMGESSAKTLRGSSMADVIFNGSTARNPADSAEVELVFSEVNIPQYPDAEEIAVKRRLSRDGQSQYFINGIRCRRKDITDIFLGTGLGPRSYAIIEQGMISRFIEAKPDELRNFIEEAAGIAKYKERRRETELRMEHTRENMERLDDVRQEVDKQLERLKRQVRAAEKYRQLKEAEQLLRGQLLAMRWKNFNAEVENLQAVLDERQPRLEAIHQRLLELEEIEARRRDEAQQAQTRFGELQENYYTHQAELEKLAQNIEHSREKQEQLAWDLEQATQGLEESRQTLETDGAQLAGLQAEIQAAEAELAEVHADLAAREEARRAAESAVSEAESAWENFNRQLTEPGQQIQVERQRGESLVHSLERNRERLQRLADEKQELDLGELETTLGQLELQIQEAEAELAQLRENLEQQQDIITHRREEGRELTQALNAAQGRTQQARGRLASLEALQEAALGKQNSDVMQWLASRGFSGEVPRLAQVIKVEAGWERAVETVLGAYLEALCIEDLEPLTTRLDDLPQGKLSALDTRLPPRDPPPSGGPAPRLADKVEGEWPVAGLLAGIYVAESFSEAYRLRERLGAHESVITAQGLWLGPNWLSITEDMDERAGVFAREQDIQRLKQDILEAEQQVMEMGDQLEQSRQALHRAEESRDQCGTQISGAQQYLGQLQSQRGGHQARLEQMSQRAQRLLQEYNELNEQVEREQEELEISRARLLEAEQTLETLEAGRENLAQAREQARERLEQTRAQLEAARDRQYQVEGRAQAMRADAARLQQGMTRLEANIEQLKDREYDLRKALEAQQSLDAWEQQFNAHQDQQGELSGQLEQAREAVKQAESHLRETEAEQRKLEKEQEEQRKLLEDTRLNHQSNLVRRQNVEEQLAQLPFELEKLLEELPAEANETTWREGLDDVEKRLQKLGSINMAALEEYEEQEQRKKYLDEQFADLENAMKLLEQAIEEIDIETRNRFRGTLDQVNNGFQTLFPHVFGGGEAYLKLTSEDILSAGVVVMARPPGKRNSTIHLLSGGEKALTAVALVFAIFELNPAPFCMLDEVDAPLDDTNVSRFCHLVTKMSEHVQFIFITHNKITMEMADQLLGVTMQEPGVSRPVSVDIDLAVEMVAA